MSKNDAVSDTDTRIHAAGIFLKAADYIKRYGWQKEGMGEHGQPRCSMGALDSAHPIIIWDEELAIVMYTSLYKELDGISLTSFNSKFESGEKVAHLYERVAARLSTEDTRLEIATTYPQTAQRN